MKSLKSTTGWDANKQTSINNSTYSHTQVRSEAIGNSQQFRHTHPPEANSKSSRRKSKIRAVNGTPAPSSNLATSSASSGSTLSTSKIGLGSSGVDVTGAVLSSTSPLDAELELMRQRELFYRDNYDYMTGIRIASTLGGFFLIVLLTLLYKSKCKGKHSREPSTLTLNSIPYPVSNHPSHMTLMRGQNIQVNGRRHHHYHHDFGGGGGGHGGGSPGANAAAITQLLDNSSYGYMNQVHPANSHQPVFSNFVNNNHAGPGIHPKNPAVLLITAANSESSEDEEEQSELVSRGGWAPHPGCPEEPPPQLDRRLRTANPLGPIPPYRQAVQQSNMHHLGGGGKGNIDINVILPTPSISPSGSENFNLASAQYFGGASNSGGGGGRSGLFPSSGAPICGSASATSSAGVCGRGRLVLSHSLSSDQSEVSMCGGDVSECSSGSEGAAAAFGAANSLFSLDNLKYVDDTSSENIPTSGHEDGDERADTRSIGSDSVFACFDHNFDHIAPTYARRVSSVSGTSSGVLLVHSSYPGSSSPLPRHLQHPCQQYHDHCSPQSSPAPVLAPAPPSPNPSYSNPAPLAPPATSAAPESGTTSTNLRAASSSGFCEGTTEETSDFRVTFTHAQVHHRDSFSSDLESVNDYMETGARRRRSSSTQTTLSDLRQALGCSVVTMGWSNNTGPDNNGGATSPGTISLTSTHHSADISTGRRLSVPRRRRSLSPKIATARVLYPQGICGHLALSPRNSSAATSPPHFNIHPSPPPKPPNSLPLGKPTSVVATTATQLSPVTPTNPPPPPTVLVSPSSPFITTKANRKRSFDAARKTLSLQCEDKPDAASLFAVSSSNETTPTN